MYSSVGGPTHSCARAIERLCVRESERERERVQGIFIMLLFILIDMYWACNCLCSYFSFFLEMAIYCLWTILKQYCMTAWHFQIRWDVLGHRFKISGPVGLAYISINPIYSYFIFKNSIVVDFHLQQQARCCSAGSIAAAFIPTTVSHAIIITKSGIDAHDSRYFPALIYLGNRSTEMPLSIGSIKW